MPFQMESEVKKHNNELLLPFKKLLDFVAVVLIDQQSPETALLCNPLQKGEQC